MRHDPFENIFSKHVDQVALRIFKVNLLIFSIEEDEPYISTSLKTIEMKRRYRYSFWDSLIIASALENPCTQLYSEDIEHGQVIESTLTIHNPL